MESPTFGRYAEWIMRHTPTKRINAFREILAVKRSVPVEYDNHQNNQFERCKWADKVLLPYSNEDDAALAATFLNELTQTGLIFFTKAGTSLGLRRHGGFLPGDSDVDIGIPVWRNAHILKGTEFEKYLCEEITSADKLTLPGHERGMLCGMTSGEWMQVVFKPWLSQILPEVPIRPPYKNEKDFYMRLRVYKGKNLRKLYPNTRLGVDVVVHVRYDLALDMCIAPFKYDAPEYEAAAETRKKDGRIQTIKVMVPTLETNYGESWQTPDRDLADSKPTRAHRCGYWFLIFFTIIVCCFVYATAAVAIFCASIIWKDSSKTPLSRKCSASSRDLIV
eukprot:CFRG2890T1